MKNLHLFKRPRASNLFLLSFLFAYTVLFSGAVLAWSGPSASAPSNNVSAPINVGSSAQIKTGGIWASSIGSDSGYCIGSSCITSWPSASTDLWTKSGSSIYYNSGNVGIGVSSPYFALQVDQGDATGGGIYVTTNGQDGTGLNGISNGYTYTQTSSATRYPIADSNSVHAGIAAGVTNSGYVMGIDDTILRNYSSSFDDSGTLASLIGQRVQYGNYNVNAGASPVTTAAIGIEINPLALTGSIGTMYDLLLSGASGSNVTTHYGIYQSGSALNYFGGNVGIGDASPSQKLEVNGNLSLDPANPYIYSGGSYVVIPNGLYISGGTAYFQNQLRARGGISNDSGSYLTIAGGTSGATYFSGNVGIGDSTPSQKLTVGSAGSAANSFYDIGANTIGVNSSLYSYGLICAGNNAGSCQGTGGVVMSSSGITFPDGTKQTTAGGGSHAQTFTSSGTWTKPSGVNVVIAQCWGGGGGGYKSSIFSGGAGGGGGGYVEMTFAAAQLPSSVYVTVGGGGSGYTGTASGYPAGSGGASSFGSYISAQGGGGGGQGTSQGGGTVWYEGAGGGSALSYGVWAGGGGGESVMFGGGGGGAYGVSAGTSMSGGNGGANGQSGQAPAGGGGAGTAGARGQCTIYSY